MELQTVQLPSVREPVQPVRRRLLVVQRVVHPDRGVVEVRLGPLADQGVAEVLDLLAVVAER